MSPNDYSLALILSGGNALGAYQGGAYQALHERAFEPDWVSGASIGAINGAVICGNRREERLPRLQALWQPAQVDGHDGHMRTAEHGRRTMAAAASLLLGKAGFFAPRSIYGPLWNPLGNPEPPSLYDATPLRATLASLIDFGLLNEGAPRFCATAVDIENGDDIVFDTRRGVVTVEHLRASSALLPAFSPVEIAGRLLGDAGISINLPLDVILREPPPRPLLCLAIDLLPLEGARPRTIGETVSRAEDLLFATQSRRAIAAWQAIFAERAEHTPCPPVTLVHIAYSRQDEEVSGKAFDFSPTSAASRWAAGHDDVAAALDELQTSDITGARPGLTVMRLRPAGAAGMRLQEVHWKLGPVAG